MTVTRVDKDVDTLTLTLVADFTAPVERVWRLWADPRLLERWWGPPGFPATVEEHDLTPGGGVKYYMTGPEGEKYGGWWRVSSVTPPTSLEFTDGFADQEGRPDPEMPVTTVRMTLTGGEGGTPAVRVRHPGADGAAGRDGHGRGHEPGRRPDGRAAGGLKRRGRGGRACRARPPRTGVIGARGRSRRTSCPGRRR